MKLCSATVYDEEPLIATYAKRIVWTGMCEDLDLIEWAEEVADDWKVILVDVDSVESVVDGIDWVRKVKMGKLN